MGQQEKLVERFKACTGPFPWKDLQRLLSGLGYEESSDGGGSRRRFHNPVTNHVMRFHEPHPGKDIHLYLVKQVRGQLEEKGLM